MLTKKLNKIFDNTICFVYGVILIFLVLGIAIGAVQLFGKLWVLMKFEGITGQYIDMIADVLTLYVLVELSRSLIEYFHTSKLRLTFIIDAGIVFILRELLILIFKQEIEPDMIYAFSALLLVLGALRVSSAVIHQRDQALLVDKKQERPGASD